MKTLPMKLSTSKDLIIELHREFKADIPPQWQMKELI